VAGDRAPLAKVPLGGLMPAFNPGVLFLGVWERADRNYMRNLLPKLLQSGYRRYHEPMVGAFTMPLVAVAAGWPAKALSCSDVGLFSSVLGALVNRSDVLGLGVRIDGKPWMPRNSQPFAAGAELLHRQLILRMEAKTTISRFDAELLHDLVVREDQHVAALSRTLEALASRLEDSRYLLVDVWEHLESTLDDPQALLVTSPPAFSAGYERFYDTKGRLTWDEPSYRPWVPEEAFDELAERLRTAKCLALVQQECDGWQPAGAPVFARALADGRRVYLWSNRPQEVFEVVGLNVGPVRQPLEPRKPPVPERPSTLQLDENALLAFGTLPQAEAAWCLEAWLPGNEYKLAESHVLVAADGYAIGVLGFTGPQPQYAVPVPHVQPLRDLLERLSLQRDVARLVASNWQLAVAEEHLWMAESPHDALLEWLDGVAA
jgi:hypothetical protein